MGKTILTGKNPKQIVWCSACEFVNYLEDTGELYSEGSISSSKCPECQSELLSIQKNIRWTPPDQENLPKGWTAVSLNAYSPPYGAYQFRDTLRVMASVNVMDESNGVWLHVSASYADKVPPYKDLCFVKRIFIGDDNDAYHAFPSKDKHVNFHPYCLHLWHRLDGPTMPDFRFSEKMI